MCYSNALKPVSKQVLSFKYVPTLTKHLPKNVFRKALGNFRFTIYDFSKYSEFEKILTEVRLVHSLTDIHTK